MRMGMPHLAFLTTKYPERFLHDEKSGKADEHGQASRTSVGQHGFREIPKLGRTLLKYCAFLRPLRNVRLGLDARP